MLSVRHDVAEQCAWIALNEVNVVYASVDCSTQQLCELIGKVVSSDTLTVGYGPVNLI